MFGNVQKRRARVGGGEPSSVVVPSAGGVSGRQGPAAAIVTYLRVKRRRSARHPAPAVAASTISVAGDDCLESSAMVSSGMVENDSLRENDEAPYLLRLEGIDGSTELSLASSHSNHQRRSHKRHHTAQRRDETTSALLRLGDLRLETTATNRHTTSAPCPPLQSQQHQQHRRRSAAIWKRIDLRDAMRSENLYSSDEFSVSNQQDYEMNQRTSHSPPPLGRSVFRRGSVRFVEAVLDDADDGDDEASKAVAATHATGVAASTVITTSAKRPPEQSHQTSSSSHPSVQPARKRQRLKILVSRDLDEIPANWLPQPQQPQEHTNSNHATAMSSSEHASHIRPNRRRDGSNRLSSTEPKPHKADTAPTSRQKISYPVLNPLQRMVDESLQRVHTGVLRPADHIRFIQTDTCLSEGTGVTTWLLWCNHEAGNILHACALWNDIDTAQNILQQLQVHSQHSPTITSDDGSRLSPLAQIATAVDAEGRTPYVGAILAGNTAMAQLLVAAMSTTSSADHDNDQDDYVYDYYCLAGAADEADEHEYGTSMEDAQTSTSHNIPPAGQFSDDDNVVSTLAERKTQRRHSLSLELHGSVGYWNEDGQLVLEVPPTNENEAGLEDAANEEDIDSNDEDWSGNDYPEDAAYDDADNSFDEDDDDDDSSEANDVSFRHR